MNNIIEVRTKTTDTMIRHNDFARDKIYWNTYYSGLNEELSHPSSFAVSISSGLEGGKSILDLGCGNGRYSIYFLSLGLMTTGIDASDIAIQRLSDITSNNSNAKFLCGDFVTSEEVYSTQYDYIYSRFTLHAITAIQERELLMNARKALIPGGKIFIEARTIHDDIFGKGEETARNTFIYDDHFRRFIDPDELAEEMRLIGYEILSLEEGRGFSKTSHSDPVLLRLTAR